MLTSCARLELCQFHFYSPESLITDFPQVALNSIEHMQILILHKLWS